MGKVNVRAENRTRFACLSSDGQHFNNRRKDHCERFCFESDGESFFSVDETDGLSRLVAVQGSSRECERGNSMCLSVRSGQLVNLDTQLFFAVAENTKLAGERRMSSSFWQGGPRVVHKRKKRT